MVRHEHEEWLSRKAEKVALGEVWRGAHCHLDVGANTDEVARDVDPRVTGTHDQYFTVPIRLRALEGRRVDQLRKE